MSDVPRGARADIWFWVVGSVALGLVCLFLGVTPGVAEYFGVDHEHPILLSVGLVICSFPFFFQAAALGRAVRIVRRDPQSADRARTLGLLALAAGNVTVLAVVLLGATENLDHFCPGAAAMLVHWSYSIRIFRHLEALAAK